jgi:hypothetical protein
MAGRSVIVDFVRIVRWWSTLLWEVSTYREPGANPGRPRRCNRVFEMLGTPLLFLRNRVEGPQALPGELEGLSSLLAIVA